MIEKCELTEKDKSEIKKEADCKRIQKQQFLKVKKNFFLKLLISRNPLTIFSFFGKNLNLKVVKWKVTIFLFKQPVFRFQSYMKKMELEIKKLRSSNTQNSNHNNQIEGLRNDNFSLREELKNEMYK